MRKERSWVLTYWEKKEINRAKRNVIFTSLVTLGKGSTSLHQGHDEHMKKKA